MPPDHRPTPATIIGELLANHPEAASLLAEASHCRALAACSAACTRRRVRRGPGRPAWRASSSGTGSGHAVVMRSISSSGSLLVVVLGAGLATLNVIELNGLPGGPRPVPLALAAAAVWLTGAWLAAIAVRQQRWAAVAGIGVVAVMLGLLLVALHGLGPHPGWPASGYALGSTVLAVLTGTFILVLAIGATALMIHMEPACLLMARRRWHQAQAAYEEAAETEQADVEAVAVAGEAWLCSGPGAGNRDRGRRREPRTGDGGPCHGPHGEQPPEAPAAAVTTCRVSQVQMLSTERG